MAPLHERKHNERKRNGPHCGDECAEDEAALLKVAVSMNDAKVGDGGFRVKQFPR